MALRKQLSLRGYASAQASRRPDRQRGRRSYVDVAAALACLPFDQRAVIVLRDFERMDESAIASTLGVPFGTVKSRCARGMSTLRGRLTREGA